MMEHVNRHPRADEWIERLGLRVLEGESGWWTPAFRSDVEVRTVDGVASPAANAIYYLLDPRRPINAWHWLAADDTHVIVDGGPVEYVVVDSDGMVTSSVVTRETRPMITVPAGSYKALRLVDPAGFALICSVVTPAWTPGRVRIGPPTRIERPAWLDDLTMSELTTGVAGVRRCSGRPAT
ncbi:MULTISPECIES: cupin domain-containing protein [Microbacterium]|jgi:predicted cupin superfamily sugar epimerase|uniref:Cupin domain-containing protein n=1 Tax=Microbacterium schleiferi TaxID=69362 RepID=A0ABU7V7K7_9MICO